MAIIAVICAFLLTDLARGASALSLGLVVVAAILLDFAVSANLVFGQRAIYALGAAQRGRINGLFMSTFFAGGAIASALSGWTYAHFGWPGVSVLGVALPSDGEGGFEGLGVPAQPSPNRHSSAAQRQGA